MLTGYGLGDQHPWRPSSPFDSLPPSDHDRVHQNASSSICLAFVCQKNTLRNSFHPAFPMTTTVTCQSKSCPNGNPPSRLECPTCNKLFYFSSGCLRTYSSICLRIRLEIQGSFFCSQECFKGACEYLQSAC